MSNEPKWTPGPWRIEEPKDELLHFGAHTLGGRPSITIWANSPAGTGFYHEVALVADSDIADAHLIAAAPELYEALAWVWEHIAAQDAAAWAPVKNALARARGETI